MNIVNKLKSIIRNSNIDEKKLLSGTLWNLLGNGLSKILMLISSVYVADLLEAEVFGKWGIIRSTSSMFTIFLGFGVGVSALKYVALFHQNEKDRTGNILGLAISFALFFGLFLTAVFFFMSDFLSFNIIKDETIAFPLKISSVLLFFIALNGVFSGGLAGFGNFKAIAISNFLSAVIGVPFIIFLSDTYNLIGVVIGYIIYYMFIFLFLCFSFIKEIKLHNIKISLKDYNQNLSILFNHNIPAILSGGLGGIAVWCVNAYVARLNGGFSIIGINNAAKIVQNSLMELSAQLDVPILSYLSRAKHSKRSDLINLFSPIIIVNVLIVPIIYFPEIITWMFKESSYRTNDFMVIVSFTMITCFIMIFKRGLGRLTITNNLLWFGLVENVIWVISIFTSIILLVPLYGAFGYALAFLLSYLIDIIIITPFFYKKGLVPRVLSFSKEILMWWVLCLLGGLLVFFEIDIVIKIPIFILSYIGSLYLSKLIYTKINY